MGDGLDGEDVGDGVFGKVLEEAAVEAREVGGGDQFFQAVEVLDLEGLWLGEGNLGESIVLQSIV